MRKGQQRWEAKSIVQHQEGDNTYPTWKDAARGSSEQELHAGREAPVVLKLAPSVLQFHSEGHFTIQPHVHWAALN